MIILMFIFAILEIQGSKIDEVVILARRTSLKLLWYSTYKNVCW